MAFDPRLRSPKERPLFILGLIFSTAVWMAMIVSIIGVFYGAFFLVFMLAVHALFLAHVRGNGVRVSRSQLPELYERCRQIASRLGLDEVPEVYLLQAGGVLNAFATKLLSRRVVIIYSQLADNCEDPRQLDFVIGHEMAHLAAGHLRWQAFLFPFMALPWLGPAYSRAREYTCDRAGLEVSGSLEAAMRGLGVLAAGGRYAQRIDLQSFMDQRAESGSFWMSVVELSSSHPFLCKRAAALQEFVRPGSVAPVERNVLAYPFAPFFGFAAAGGSAGSLLIVMAIVGMLAAIAIPNFRKFQERAQARQHLRMQQQEDLQNAAPAADKRE